MVVFFGVWVGGGADVVATPRLSCAQRSGAAERDRREPEDELMQHLAALDAEAIVYC